MKLRIAHLIWTVTRSRDSNNSKVVHYEIDAIQYTAIAYLYNGSYESYVPEGIKIHLDDSKNYQLSYGTTDTIHFEDTTFPWTAFTRSLNSYYYYAFNYTIS